LTVVSIAISPVNDAPLFPHADRFQRKRMLVTRPDPYWNVWQTINRARTGRPDVLSAAPDL
jgi:hypothetical protein